MPKKQSGDKVSTIASKGLRGEKLTKSETKSVCGSVMSQDEKNGKRGK